MVPRCIFRQNAPAVPATRLSRADESRGRTRVGCCCAMRQAAGRLWREIREVPLLRYVFAVSESDELTNCSNQVTQAQRSIHTDISRNRRQCSEIRDSESRKNIGLRKVGVAAEREESHRHLDPHCSVHISEARRSPARLSAEPVPRDVAPRCGISRADGV